MRILFMGTPDFAVPSLRALYGSGEEIVGVVTQPDKPRGRGYVLTPPPVKAYAEAHGMRVYQPQRLRDGSFDATVAELAPELIVVVAYGKILPPSILEAPPFGCINVHGSLLPALRGAAPMQRAILDGLDVTGVTTMYMAEGMDTGDMLLRTEVPIREEDNFGSVHDRMAEAGAALLLETLAALRAGTLTRVPQDESLATYAPKIEKADCLLDFSLPVKTVFDRVRGLSPAPLSFTHTPDGKLLKVAAARRTGNAGAVGQPGTVLSLHTERDGGIEVACGDGSLLLTRVVPEGKAAMSAADYIRGRRLSVGDLLK
jgi:methionyl-tRNA formyltransferase